MTKPLGQSDSRDIQDNHRTFYGQPIVVRVKDLTWQPPAPEAPPAQDAWVSNLLGEDPYEAPSEDSLLMDVPAPPIDDEELVGTLPQPAPAPEKPKPQPASTTPTYLRHKAEKSRRDHLTEVILGHSKKVLGLGGLALSLILFSYWMLAGDTSEPPVEDVDQELFVELGDSSAPAWPPAGTPESETITVESTTPSAPQIASLPTREDRGMSTPAQYNTPQTQLPTIGTPDVEMDSNPSNPAVNPAYLDNPEPSSTESSGGYVPSFSPTGNAYPPMGETSPAAGNNALQTEGNIPNFDGGAPSDYNTPAEQPYVPSYGGGATSGYGEPAASTPQTNTGNASPYPSTNSGADPQIHWALKEGKLHRPDSTNGMTNNASGSQLPSIQNGAPQGQGLPQIENPGQTDSQPYYTDYNMPASSPTGNSQSGGQSNNGFSFNPGGNGYAAPATGTNEGPRSAARLGGNIEPYDPGLGIR